MAVMVLIQLQLILDLNHIQITRITSRIRIWHRCLPAEKRRSYPPPRKQDFYETSFRLTFTLI